MLMRHMTILLEDILKFLRFQVNIKPFSLRLTLKKVFKEYPKVECKRTYVCMNKSFEITENLYFSVSIKKISNT